MPPRARSVSSSPDRQPRSSTLKNLERCCCSVLTSLPLGFVYGLTTWAMWVGASIGFAPYSSGHFANPYTSVLVVILYILAASSYTASVFTPPGSPLDPLPASAYSSLPTTESGADPLPHAFSSLMAKSTGKPRYCKKCVCAKPDRAHHCSTCNQCVLKMDHHCPWLATCVGLHNYKAFLLFLIYICLFCYVTFVLSAEWVWRELFDVENMDHGTMVVNIVLLSVLSGIIGLVMTAFTAWHLYLAMSNQTTIECLEKTRYLSPLKHSMEQQLRRSHQDRNSDPQHTEPLLDQLKEIHANALPGVTRPEEGESTSGLSTPRHDSPATESLRRSYRELEEQRERDRYAEYLDEQDNKKLPNAFNLGWRRNMELVFGTRRLLWPVPIHTTVGDGWSWQVSDAWLTARDEIARERQQRTQTRQYGYGQSHGQGAGRHYYDPPPAPPQGPPRHHVEMRRLDREEGDEYDTSSDEELRPSGPTTNWNDVPVEYFRRGPSTGRGGSRGRTKGD